MAIKVLYLLHKFTFGGTERVVANIVNNAGPGVENYICSFFDYDKQFKDELADPEKTLFTLSKKPGNDFSVPFKLAAFCRKKNIDIIHSMGWATYVEGLVASKLFRKAKFIFSFRGKTMEDMVHIPKRRIYAQKFLSFLCDALLTNSEMSRKEYAADIGIKKEKLKVIYNGVDINQFSGPDGAKLNQKRNRLGIQDNDIVIGSIARLDPVKNAASLVNAFSMLDEKLLAQCKLLLVGDGPDRNKIEQLTNALKIKNNVILAGMRQDIPDCLKMMQIYVQPSIFENIPNSILEAMASGLPVIATHVGGVCEVVSHQKTGLLVSLTDQKEWVKAMSQLIKNEKIRLDMGKKAFKVVEDHFTIAKMVLAFEQLYAKMVQH
jgi:glycosyltransferase involved in cell wall biosynthesis